MDSSIYGIFESEESFVSALRKLKHEQVEIGEAFMPYPVHDVFKIMGSKNHFSKFTFLFALLGLGLSYWFMYWSTVVDYPLSYGGKPIHSVPSFIIIGFISMISLSVLLSVLMFLISTKLYPGNRRLCPDPRITDDAFVIYINKATEMPVSEFEKINSILKENGAIEVLEKEII